MHAVVFCKGCMAVSTNEYVPPSFKILVGISYLRNKS